MCTVLYRIVCVCVCVCGNPGYFKTLNFKTLFKLLKMYNDTKGQAGLLQNFAFM